MTTDEERREVARRLRETADKHDGVAAFIVERRLGLESDDKFLFGSVFTSDSVQRIADLIDPDCGTQEADSSPVPEHNADLSKMVDRDALLELADEFERDADEAMDYYVRSSESAAAGESVAYRDCARRIRGACGEVGR